MFTCGLVCVVELVLLGWVGRRLVICLVVGGLSCVLINSVDIRPAFIHILLLGVWFGFL